MSRKLSTGIGLIAAAAFALAGCTDTEEAASGGSTDGRTTKFDWGTFTIAQRIEERLQTNQPIRIVSSYQGTGIPIAGAQNRIGLEKACEEESKTLPLDCRLVGPASTDFPAQAAELETLLNSDQVECLVLASGDPNAFTSIVNKYVDAGIPVFTQNGDVPDSKRFAFFALNEEKAAKANAEATIAVMKERGIDVNEVAMGSGLPTAPWAKGRMKGFEEGMKAGIPEIKFFNSADDGLPTGVNFTVDEVVNSVGPFLSAHPDVSLFFHTDQGVEGVGQVIRDNNLSGKVWASGFNVSKPILDGIESGDVLVTVDQGFDNQAGAAAKACVSFLAEGKLPKQLSYLEPIVVTKTGVNDSMTVDDARARLEAAQ